MYHRAVELCLDGDNPPSFSRSNSDDPDEKSQSLSLMDEAFMDDARGNAEIVESIRNPSPKSEPAVLREPRQPPPAADTPPAAMEKKPSLLSSVKLRSIPAALSDDDDLDA